MNRKQRRAHQKQLKERRIHPQQVLSYAIGRHRQGDTEEAEKLYRAILKFYPDFADALHFLGVLQHQQGKSEEAISLIEKALGIQPDYTDAYNNLGNVFKELGRFEEAADAYRNALNQNSLSWNAHNNLGVVLKVLGRCEESIDHFRRALEIEPQNPDCYQNLGNAYKQLEQYAKAIDCYRTALELRPYDEDSYKFLCRTLYITQQHEEAIALLKKWIQFDPNNAVAHHTLAAYTQEQVPSRASDHYIRKTFDSFASSFDQVLGNLHYQAPQLVAEAVAARYGADDSLEIFDIGCGTGLCAPLLRPFARRLTGIDLSTQMLALARRRNLYDELVEAELTEFLARLDNAADLIVSADTLVYLGDLSAALKAAGNALRSGGRIIFTLEEQPATSGDGFALHYHGRYAHTRLYAQRTLEQAGLACESIQPAVLRKEMGEAVTGLVMTARKP